MQCTVEALWSTMGGAVVLLLVNDEQLQLPGWTT